MVEETLAERASVAGIARAHGVNANQLFGWRRRTGSNFIIGFCSPSSAQVQAVSIEVAKPKPIPGTIHIELRQAQIRIEGDPTTEKAFTWSIWQAKAKLSAWTSITPSW